MKNQLKSSFIEVWKISWPLIIANSFWNLQITIDRMFLGQSSTEALAASIAVGAIFWAPMALVQQTAAYVTTFVAQYLGSNQKEWIGPSLWHAIYVSLIGGLLFLLLIPLAPFVFGLVGHSSDIQILEVKYFQALAFSALPTSMVAVCSGFFTGLGKSKVIMLINAVGLVFNLLFDYLFIFGHGGFPAMGIVGAGIATSLATLCATVLGLSLVFFGAEGRAHKVLQNWRFNGALMKRFLRFGIPSGMQWALEGVAFSFFLIFIGRLPNGGAALAASSVTVNVMLLAILPPMGIAQGVSALVGQYLGDNKTNEAVRVTWAGLSMVLLFILTMSISFVSFPEFYMSFFKNDKGGDMWNQVSVMVPYLLIFVSVFVIFDSANLVFSFALKGAGDTTFVSSVALLLPWPVMVLPTWYVSDWPNGVYWAWAAASLFIVLQAFIFWARFVQGKWKTMRVF